MSNDTIVTIRGFAAADPQVFTNAVDPESGEGYERQCTVFRIGVTPSYYSSASKEFRNGITSWYTVRTYGTLAQNVAESVRRGSALMVRGRLNIRQYTDNEGNPRQENVIIADGVGLDLNSGTGHLIKRRRDPLPAVEGEPSGRGEGVLESDESEHPGDGGLRQQGLSGTHGKNEDLAGNLARV